MFFDTHAHLTCDELFEDLVPIVERAKEASVNSIVNICTDASTLERGLELSLEGVYNAGSTTPHDVEKEGEKYFPLFEKAALSKQLVAVGETGLDYFYEHSEKKLQQHYLEKYLDLAKRANLPLIFHCRDAFDDLFAIAKSYDFPAILHCFTGTLHEAKQGIDRGWLVSFSGIFTFKRSHELRTVAKALPLSSLVIETDSPYLAPQSKRGKKCESAFVIETAEKLAEVKGISIEEVAKVTTENANKLFFPSKYS